MTAKILYVYSKLNREYAYLNKHNRYALSLAAQQKQMAKKKERLEGRKECRIGQ